MPWSVTLPGGGVADPTPYLGRDVNPAAIVATDSSELFLLYSEALSGGEFATVLGDALHVGFAVDRLSDAGRSAATGASKQELEPGTDVSVTGTVPQLSGWRTSLDIGLGLGNMAGLGFTWQSLSGDGVLDGRDPLSAGIFIRGSRWASVGFSARNMTEENLGSGHEGVQLATGIAVRPLTDRVTVSFDAVTNRGGDFVDPEASLSIMPLKGFTLTANAWTRDDELQGRQWGAGGMLTINMLHSDFHAGYVSDDDGNSDMMAAVRLSGSSAPTVLSPSGLIVRYRLPGGFNEGRTGGVFAEPRPSLLDVRVNLARLAEDPEVAAVLIEIHGTSAGWAQTQEMAESIRYLKAKGKKIIAYLVAGGNREYYLAAQADKIVATPALALFVTGISGNLTFLKDFLGIFGVEAQFVRIGKYKSFPEPLTLNEPTPEYVEAHTALMDAFFGQLVDGIAAGRKVERDKVVGWIDSAPFTAQKALEAGLVDKVATAEELDGFLEKEGLNPRRLVDGYPVRDYRTTQWGAPARVAVLVIQGSIVDGRSMTVPLVGNRLCGAQTILAAIKAISQDRGIEGVILRVDSPGGSALASELMNRALVKLAEKKPLIVSIGDTAASGGYYVSATGTDVLAMPGSVTGSIGIYFGKVVVSGLLDKLDIHRYRFSKGRNADLLSMDHRLTEEQIEASLQRISDLYDLFLRRVAKARGKTRDDVDAIGQGRVWSGAKGVELGLVNRVGGSLEALQWMKSKLDIAADEEVDLEYYPQLSFGEALQQALLGGSASASYAGIADSPLAAHGLAPDAESGALGLDGDASDVESLPDGDMDLGALHEALSSLSSTHVWALDPWAGSTAL